MLFLHRMMQGRLAQHYSQGGARDDSTNTDNSQPAAASTQPIDPVFVNGPWARKQVKPQSTRWEDLVVVDDHPFSSNGVVLQQVHRLQLPNQRQGLVMTTKQHLAELTKISPAGTLAFLLPAADKAVFGDAANHMKGPYEIVLKDEALRTTYKRLVLMFVAQGNVKYALPDPTCKCEAADHVEIVLGLDSRLIPHSEFEQAKQDATGAFKRLLHAVRPVLTVLSLYGPRQHRHPSASSKICSSRSFARSQGTTGAHYWNQVVSMLCLFVTSLTRCQTTLTVNPPEILAGFGKRSSRVEKKCPKDPRCCGFGLDPSWTSTSYLDQPDRAGQKSFHAG